MNAYQLERDIGQLCADVKNLRAMQNEMRCEIVAMRSQLDQMRGGKAALFALLTVAAGIGAMITQAFIWWR